MHVGLNIESEAARFRREHQSTLWDRIQVDIADGDETHVTIRYDLPKPPRRGWQLTTDRRTLPRVFSPVEARSRITFAEGKDRNRILTVAGSDRDAGETGARNTWGAALFHVDPRHEVPVLLRALALLPPGHAERDRSVLAGAFMVEALALLDARLVWEHHERRGSPLRRPAVACDARAVLMDEVELLTERLRFARAPRPAGYKVKGPVDWLVRHSRWEPEPQ